MDNFYKDKKILLTGAAGTVGREIIEQILLFQPKELRLIDNNETEMFFLAEKYQNRNVFSFLGDVRDRDKVEKLAKEVDIIIHSAALKHVQLSEYNPFNAVQTNIVGVENIIRAGAVSNVNFVLFTSSDKAVNPTSVMGTSKLMGERLITAANAVNHTEKCIFTSTRFGNVLGSRGSVVPLFMQQIRKGGPITLTDSRMTRFIMTVAEAARLVLKSLLLAKGGEVFVTKMPVVKIADLAEVMIEILAPRYGFKPSAIEIREIGAKPGEKLYEELMSSEEVSRSLELDDMFVITPAFKSIYQSIKYEYPNVVSEVVHKSYISATEEALDKRTLKDYLIERKVLEEVGESFYRGGL
ncbi:MAG: polysaccharide biosynthesis protein [Deltaproteobacteria bacterium]|nr:MAG: polysaccharide biosynthesis protein [Deltaproteobacteria bacterium]